jgi:hypothetical protein
MNALLPSAPLVKAGVSPDNANLPLHDSFISHSTEGLSTITGTGSRYTLSGISPDMESYPLPPGAINSASPVFPDYLRPDSPPRKCCRSIPIEYIIPGTSPTDIRSFLAWAEDAAAEGRLHLYSFTEEPLKLSVLIEKSRFIAQQLRTSRAAPDAPMPAPPPNSRIPSPLPQPPSTRLKENLFDLE